MKYPNILSALQNTIWAITPEKLDAICGFLEAKSTGMAIDAATLEKVAAVNRKQRTGTVTKSVGVLPVIGVISQRMDMISEFSGGTSTERLRQEFNAMLADSSVSSILMEFDTPGGGVCGVPEFAETIFNARGTKPIVAQVNSQCGSAGLWLAAACDEIVVTPSGDVGSHGVLAVHDDYSEANEKEGVKRTFIHYGKYKVEGNSDEPLSDEARTEIQRRVDEVGDMFTAALAKYRGVSKATVKSQFGQGRMFGPKEAIERGIADRMGTMEETLTRIVSGRKITSKRRAEVARRRLALTKVS